MIANLPLIQERDFGQKINATFDFIRQNFKPLLLAILVIGGTPTLLAYVVGGLGLASLVPALTQMRQGGSPNYVTLLAIITPLMGTIFFVALLFIVSSVMSSLSLYGYVLEYEARGGNSPAISVADVWRRVSGSFWRYVGYSIALALLFFVALLVLGFLIGALGGIVGTAGIGIFSFAYFIAVIYISVTISLYYFIVVRENLGIIDSIKRCFYLIQGKWWSTFGLLFILGLVSLVLFVGTYFVSVLLLGAFGLAGAGIGSETLAISLIISTIISSLFSTLIGIVIRCISSLGLVFQYYNLVERKDGEGLANAIQGIGNAKTPTTDDSEADF